MQDVMVDLETLGTAADSVIMSIGAVKFDLLTGKIEPEGFYASVSIESNLSHKRRISEDTLLWWLKQGAAAQGVFHEQKQTLESGLTDFADWLEHDKFNVWSNGADFDIPMLAHAYSQLQMEVPWQFWNNQCYRTYKKLPGAKAVKMVRTGVHHNALADAYSQAVHVCEIYKTLFGKKVKA